MKRYAIKTSHSGDFEVGINDIYENLENVVKESIRLHHQAGYVIWNSRHPHVKNKYTVVKHMKVIIDGEIKVDEL